MFLKRSVSSLLSCPSRVNPSVDASVNVNVMGDTVIQVKYPIKIIEKIRVLFEKYANVQQMNMREITELAHASCEIKFVMFRNPTIAANLRSTYAL